MAVYTRCLVHTGAYYLAYLGGMSSGGDHDYSNFFKSEDGIIWDDTGWGGWDADLLNLAAMAADPDGDNGNGIVLGLPATPQSKLFKTNKNLTSHSEITDTPDGNFIAFGGDTWIIVGDNGAVYTSTDGGQNWTQRSLANGVTANLYGAVYGDGIWVVCGANGTIQYSTDDGVTWHAATPADSFSGTFYGAAYGRTFFVVCGENGEIQSSSSPGDSWTHRDAAESYNKTFKAVAWGAPYFCLVGEDGEIQYVEVS